MPPPAARREVALALTIRVLAESGGPGPGVSVLPRPKLLVQEQWRLEPGKGACLPGSVSGESANVEPEFCT